MNKALLTLGSLVATITAAIFIFQNWYTATSVSFVSWTWPQMSVGMALLTTFILGSLGTFFKSLSVFTELRGDVKQYELRKEKAEVKAETTTDQVRALESKIQTLEKALEQALSATANKDR